MQKTIRVLNQQDKHSDRDFWISKSPEERIGALETLRQQYIKLHGLPQRLQRVCRTTTQK